MTQKTLALEDPQHQEQADDSERSALRYRKRTVAPETIDGPVVLDPRDWRPLLSFVYDVLPGGPDALGLPCTAKWFDAKARRPRGWEALSFHGLGGDLTIRRVLAHLAGTMTLSLPPPHEYPKDARRYFELDVDRHSEETETWVSFAERLVACGRALGLLPTAPRPNTHAGGGAILAYGEWVQYLDDLARQMRRLLATPGVVLWRSSSGRDENGRCWPGGARLRVYVEWSGSDAELRECVVGMLKAGGVEIKGGYVEVWPHGAKPTRIPLGLESCVIDEHGNPRFADVKNGRLYRHLGADIEAFAEAAREPRPLPKVTWASYLITSSTGTRAEKERRRGAEGAIELRAAKRRVALDASTAKRKSITTPGPLRERGQRVITSGSFLCYLRTGLGLTPEQALVPYERWLRRTDHVGDLAVSNDGRGKLIEQMLGAVRADFDRQDRKVAAGQLVPGVRGKRAKPPRDHATPGVSIDTLLGHVPPARLEAALTAADHAALDSLDPWLRKRLRNLLGCIRVVQEIDGPCKELAVTYRAVELIAGTRRPRGWEHDESPHYKHRSRRTGGLGTAPYRVVLAAAQRLGFLGAVVRDGERGVTATVFALP